MPHKFYVPLRSNHDKPKYTDTGARIPDEVLPPEHQGDIPVEKMYTYCMRDVELTLFNLYTCHTSFSLINKMR